MYVLVRLKTSFFRFFRLNELDADSLSVGATATCWLSPPQNCFFSNSVIPHDWYQFQRRPDIQTRRNKKDETPSLDVESRPSAS